MCFTYIRRNGARTPTPVALAASAFACLAACAAQAAPELDELGLEELTQLTVSTAARRAQKADDVAAAVFVITQDDIRRSGARSIPEALRLAPGLQVARIDNARWAVAARGFNSRFSNKLLVLMDGRTLYSQSFNGTYWDVQDTVLEDVDRIEVILGPAGTIWGTNAVNGIINIITKRAAQTGELSVSATGEPDGSGALAMRFGRAREDGNAWRVYAKFLERDANELLTGAPAYDQMQQLRTGVRSDLQLSERDALSFSAETYRGYSGQTRADTLFIPIPFDAHANADRENVDGTWGLLRWSRTTAPGSRLELQTYLDHADRRGSVYEERRDSLDFQLQHTIARRGAHTLVWGLGAALNQDRFTPTQHMQMIPAATRYWLVNAYAQDEAALYGDRVLLTAGVRYEESNEYGDDALLPNLRARFNISDRASVWAALGAGVRRPGRIEMDSHLTAVEFPPNSPVNPLPLPMAAVMRGDRSTVSEELTAYELGWRWRPNESWSVAVSTFYNEYDHLLGANPAAVYCEPEGTPLADDPTCIFRAQELVGYASLSSKVNGALYGGEALARWSPLPGWRLTAAYSRLHKEIEANRSDPVVDMLVFGMDSPHSYLLRSTVSIGPRWEWDVTARSNDRLTAAPMIIGGYTGLGARLAFRANADWELALVGANLLHSAQVEALSPLSDLLPTAVERSLSLQLRWTPQ